MGIAIDFGTSNTVITRINPTTGKGEIIKLANISQNNPKIPPLIPSLVYVNNAEKEDIIIGQKVRDKGLDINNNPRYFRDFKRGIGAEIQGFLPSLEDKNIRFEDIGQWYLSAILKELKETPDSLIITVPVDSFENYRHWLTGICEQWNINQVRIIDEPTAAALGYGSESDNLLLVVDFGGGTIDFSLVELDLGKSKKSQGFILKWGEKLLGENNRQKTKLAKVIAKSGTNLGGCDIDNWILDYFHNTQGVTKSSLTLRLGERLKIQLSSQKTAQEVFFNDVTLDTYDLRLDRAKFEQILTENLFFDKLDQMIDTVLEQGKREGVQPFNIDKVLLVGGSGQIPAVQTWLQKYFPSEKIKSDQPFTAIATGALKLEQGLQVKDFLYHSYGIRYWNRRQKRHDWHTIIPNGQPYPMSNFIELTLAASVENQPSIELIIGELGEENTSTEVYFDGDRLVTRNVHQGEKKIQPLNDNEGGKTIARLNPLGIQGSDRIKVLFIVDEKRRLKITVEDLLTNETLLNDVIVAQLS
ncbi:MAG: Hsp70 family protein [Cyanobacteria bacterium]|nr:Hsp70 family protein [Cyanobacteria bacterium CG_2015-16_32_12]NCO78233.1 Hsp70 family protein [Cyanobacteria bacterium CG_2015-22_32_23]NCQ03274.1 Hsp70 family protein [Cyanobacteria bacterium CG_2015-09_32_10]NCQ41959.1 Hsp70 family protein [Cyanobacteria bacterium CG_2015-04_32_10]NCS85707.1 Hsp70 family protein [Cyanobacteria bacterium CG_2015-02_32_10]